MTFDTRRGWIGALSKLLEFVATMSKTGGVPCHGRETPREDWTAWVGHMRACAHRGFSLPTESGISWATHVGNPGRQQTRQRMLRTVSTRQQDSARYQWERRIVRAIQKRAELARGNHP